MEQTTLFYTQEEMNNAISTTRDLATRDAQRTTRDTLIEVLRDCARDGIVERDTAQNIYDRIASALGLSSAVIASLYTVEVIYQGEVLLEVSDIEADDEDSAESEVSGNLELSGTLHITAEYGDRADTTRIDVDGYDLVDEVEYNTYEQQ
jgi:hypothetical protein